MLQLSIATGMVVLTVVFHLVGLSLLMEVVRRRPIPRVPRRSIAHRSISIFVAAIGLFALHTVEIWAYAGLYVHLGALADFEEALYFSTSTYSTVGYGDLVLPRPWRILGAIEGANGIILLGWSTAFFISVVDQIRRMETEIEE